MIPGQARTIACLSFSYVTKIVAAAVLLFAVSGANFKRFIEETGECWLFDGERRWEAAA